MDLCKEPNMDEVRRVIFSIDLTSVPSLNGLCRRFY